MEVKFLSDELKLLYQAGFSKKYKTVPAQVAKKFVRAVYVLSAATVIQDVWKFLLYQFEHLSTTFLVKSLIKSYNQNYKRKSSFFFPKIN